MSSQLFKLFIRLMILIIAILGALLLLSLILSHQISSLRTHFFIQSTRVARSHFHYISGPVILNDNQGNSSSTLQSAD